MQSHLSEIEAGKCNASVDLIGAIALAVPVAALSDGQVEQTRPVQPPPFVHRGRTDGTVAPRRVG